MKESQKIEWKESWRDDYLRWICGFANAEGGVLVIGRDDKGRVVGIADASRLLEELPNKIRDLLGIVVEVNLCSEGGKEYLEVVTPAYPSPISYRGHYHQRSGRCSLGKTLIDRTSLGHQQTMPVHPGAIRCLCRARPTATIGKTLGHKPGFSRRPTFAPNRLGNDHAQPPITCRCPQTDQRRQHRKRHHPKRLP